MNSENQEVIYCADDDDEYRISFNNCDKLCIGRVYKNLLKSGTHILNTRKKQPIKQSYTNKFRSILW